MHACMLTCISMRTYVHVHTHMHACIHRAHMQILLMSLVPASLVQFLAVCCSARQHMPAPLHLSAYRSEFRLKLRSHNGTAACLRGRRLGFLVFGLHTSQGMSAPSSSSVSLRFDSRDSDLVKPQWTARQDRQLLRIDHTTMECVLDAFVCC